MVASWGSGEEAEDVDDEEGNKAVIGSCTVELPSKVTSVQVLLQTDYMQPIQARIELELRMIDSASSSGSRVVKRTIVEVYSEDGMHRPFFAICPRVAVPGEVDGNHMMRGGKEGQLR